MKETALESDSKTLAWMMGWVNCKGSAAGRNGVADQWFMKSGRGFVVEFKKFQSGKQKINQQNEQKLCEDRGVPYYLCDNLAAFKEILILEEDKLNE